MISTQTRSKKDEMNAARITANQASIIKAMMDGCDTANRIAVVVGISTMWTREMLDRMIDDDIVKRVKKNHPFATGRSTKYFGLVK